jgi:hypothetical protein
VIELGAHRVGDADEAVDQERGDPPVVTYGRPMTSYSPLASTRRSPIFNCIGRTRCSAGGSGSRFFSGRGLAIYVARTEHVKNISQIDCGSPHALLKATVEAAATVPTPFDGAACQRVRPDR